MSIHILREVFGTFIPCLDDLVLYRHLAIAGIREVINAQSQGSRQTSIVLHDMHGISVHSKETFQYIIWKALAIVRHTSYLFASHQQSRA